MPMTVPGLSSALQSDLASVSGFRAGSPEAIDFCDKLATAIVKYIQANATVIPTALVAPSGGGPVTGVGTVT